jgi:hypothetical protein
MQGITEYGQCPDISTLRGPHILKKDAMNGDRRTIVQLVPTEGLAIKTEQHSSSIGPKLYNLHCGMVSNPDPTCAQVLGVRIEEIQLNENTTKFCEVTTWVELLAGEAPTASCLTVPEARQLYDWVLSNARWIRDDPRDNIHGDLHPDNIRLFRSHGQLTMKVIDFGNAVRDRTCVGDIRAFDKEMYRYVRKTPHSFFRLCLILLCVCCS